MKTGVISLSDWTFVKERGATARSGSVYRSAEGDRYLRTGALDAIRKEAEFAVSAWQRGFPVPEVTETGILPDGSGYFVEMSAGHDTFAHRLAEEYELSGTIGDALFESFSRVALSFLTTQIQEKNRQAGPMQLREGIRLTNVLSENPDIPAEMMERFMLRVETRTGALPIVFTHGDFTPFNILENGVIDFEERFLAPAGYDAITCVTFQRFWDHPRPDGTGTMQRWNFSRRQVSEYLARADALCIEADVPAISPFFDDFLALKAIWALCFERPEDETSPQARRWEWRKRVALYCVTRYLEGRPIQNEAFRSIGLGKEIN